MGETNEAFYSNIYTGQALPRPPRPPRPPPPRLQFHHIRTHSNDERSITTSINSLNDRQEDDGDNGGNEADDGGGAGGGQPWFCNMCTFQNHPLLNKCEQCEMPLLTTSGTSLAANSSSGSHRQLTNASMPADRLLQQQRLLQSAPPIVQNPFRYTNNTVFPPTIVATPSSAGVVLATTKNANSFPRLTQHTN